MIFLIILLIIWIGWVNYLALNRDYDKQVLTVLSIMKKMLDNATLRQEKILLRTNQLYNNVKKIRRGVKRNA